MSEFRFEINGTILNNHPDGWDEFTESIVRDEDLHGITTEYEAELTFAGDGYVILNGLFRDAFCTNASLKVYQSCASGFEEILDLLIKPTDLDTNLQQCTCKAKTTDSSYFGLIHSNREVSVPMSATLSKNGIGIDGCPTTEFKVFLPDLDVSDDVDYLATTRVGYDHKEALAFILRYITDGEINSVSSGYLDSLSVNPSAQYFDVDPDYGGGQPMSFYLLSGYGVRVGGEQPLRLTFQRLIETLFTKHGLFWRITGDTMVIEPISFFYQTAEDAGDNRRELPNVPNIMRSTDTTKLYSAVEVGSEQDLPDRDLRWGMPYVELIAHAKQRYNLGGQCNTDVVLNLISGYSYASNVIEKIIVTEENAATIDDKDQSQDQETFYIEVFQHTNGANADDAYYAMFSTQFIRPDLVSGLTGATYNPYIVNQNIILRHQVQSDYSFYVTDDDDNFRASKTGTDTYWNADFQDQVFYYDGLIQSGSVWDVFDSSAIPNLNALMLNTFGWPSLPQAFWWGGLVNESSENCNSFEGCTDVPLRIPFNNDSTGQNFDPNDNWDTTEFMFTAPATGVYGFDINLLINKQIDQMRVASGAGLIPTTEALPPNIPLLRAHPVVVQVYFVRYDSGGNYISNQLIYGFNSVTEEYTFEQDWIGSEFVLPGRQLNQLFNEQLGGNVPPDLNSTLAGMCLDFSHECTNSWPNNVPVNRVGYQYIESGEKVGVMAKVWAASHYRHPAFNQRYVRYGVMPGSYIRTNYIGTGGGEFAPVNPDLHYCNVYEFDKPTTVQEWKHYKNNTIAPVDISVKGTDLIRTYPNRITRNLLTQDTNFQMIGNRNQQFI